MRGLWAVQGAKNLWFQRRKPKQQTAFTIPLPSGGRGSNPSTFSSMASRMHGIRWDSQPGSFPFQQNCQSRTGAYHASNPIHHDHGMDLDGNLII